MVQICSDRVLIVGVQAGSDGSGGFGRGAAAERAGGEPCGGGLPEFTKTGAPGVDPSGALAWEDHRFMRDPLGPFARVGDGRSGELGGNGGSAAAGNDGELAFAQFWALEWGIRLRMRVRG